MCCIWACSTLHKIRPSSHRGRMVASNTWIEAAQPEKVIPRVSYIHDGQGYFWLFLFLILSEDSRTRGPDGWRYEIARIDLKLLAAPVLVNTSITRTLTVDLLARATCA